MFLSFKKILKARIFCSMADVYSQDSKVVYFVFFQPVLMADLYSQDSKNATRSHFGL